MNTSALRRFFFCILVAALSMSCAKYSTLNSSSIATQASAGTSGDPTLANYVLYPLSWEAHVAGSSNWSQFLYQTILSSAPYLLAGSSDVTNFCPNYFQLANQERANFWAYLISEIALYESDYDPLSRYVETTMGIDPITGSQVVSEGLLQLSYQDQQSYSFCQFNWAADSQLSPTDPKKTILDPYINLQCGALILNNQIKRKNLIEVASGAYWATLRPSTSSGSKTSAMKTATEKIPFCALPTSAPAS